jgi:Na+-transporting NADH:ubiquinone oxidoreductase subunit C
MKRESSLRALVVVTLVVGACSLLVSMAVVLLRPLQQDNRALEQARNVVQLLGGPAQALDAGDEQLLKVFRALDARVVDLESGRFLPGTDAHDLNFASDASHSSQETAIPVAEDTARLGFRDRLVTVYLVWDQGALDRIILPVHGMGMWSELRGFVALDPDLNTIADVSIYQQAETPGVGDQITQPEWLAKWRGRKIYDEEGVPQFAVASGKVEPGSATALHNVDAISGATVSTDGVTALVRFWFGPWGYQALLENLREHPPQAPVDTGREP